MLKQWLNDPAPMPRPAAVAPPVAIAATGLELSDDELDTVVGGLERVFEPPLQTAATAAR
jgi:hypothetical protein